MHYPQGRTLGGSTSINAMIYIRGHRLDYDEWRDLGNEGWGYDGVLPYFVKSENNERLVNEFHGTGGPLNVTEQVSHNPLTKGFVRAVQSLGVPFSHDFNGAEQDGVGYYDVTQRNVRRESAATAFLRPQSEAQEPHHRHPRARRPRCSWRAAGPSVSSTCRTDKPRRGADRDRRRGRPLRRRRQLAAAAAPVRHRPGRRAATARASTSSTTCRASARTSRTTWTST